MRNAFNALAAAVVLAGLGTAAKDGYTYEVGPNINGSTVPQYPARFRMKAAGQLFRRSFAALTPGHGKASDA